MKVSLVLLSVALLTATTPMPVGGAEMTVSTVSLDNYAAREAQAPELAQFTGGFHGVIITLALLVIVVWLVLELSDTHIEVYHHPTHPPPEPRP